MSLLTIIAIIAAVVILAGLAFWWFRRKPGADLTEDERALLRAKTFDQYTLKRVRKRATMSTMFLAVEKETKRSVALRILHPEFSSDPEHVKAFQRRGEILEFLNTEHPDLPIVRLLKHGQYRVGRYQRPFIAVEYFEGLDVGELLEQKKILSVAEATSILLQIVKALAVILRERVWHHQMALQAIMVRYPKPGAPQVELVDFDLHKQESSTSSPTAGGVDTKLVFMSPEQFDNKIVDDRSDIYSLGILYFTLLTGRPPFMGSDYGEMGRLHKATPPPPLPDAIPQPVAKIVSKMLEKQPLDRYQRMDDLAAAFEALRPEASWSGAPDASTVRPFLAPTAKPPEGTRPAEARAERRSAAPRERKKERGGIAKFIFVELPLMIVSFIGRILGAVLKKVSVKKIVIVVLVLVVGAVAYLMLRTDSVSGTLTVTIKDVKGTGLNAATLVLDPTTGADGKVPYAKFTDLATDNDTKGRFEAKSNPEGKVSAEYAVSPGTKLVAQISGPQYTPVTDTLVIQGDSAITLSYVLRRAGTEAPFMVQVKDKAKNPVPNVAVRVKGSSGREYTGTTDERGGAKMDYDPAIEGGSPMVELSAPALGQEYAQSQPKAQKASAKLIAVNINDYFPYDAALDKLLGQAESLIKKEEWKDAIAPLQQAVTLRPGPGSGKAYALLAQAWFEEDEDNFNEALKAARKALADEKHVTGANAARTIEKMHYYHVRALSEAWGRSKDSGTKQDLRTACRNYLNLFKGGSYASLLKRSSEVESHHESVKDILDDLD